MTEENEGGINNKNLFSLSFLIFFYLFSLNMVIKIIGLHGGYSPNIQP